MERKQGFFSALKEEVVRGLSPARSRRSGSPNSGFLRRRKGGHKAAPPGQFIARSGSLRSAEALSPLREGPDPNEAAMDGGDSKVEKWGHWMKGQLCRAPSSVYSANQRSDLRLLLGVLGAPLAPVHVSNNDPFPHLSIKDTPIVSHSSPFFPLLFVYETVFVFY